MCRIAYYPSGVFDYFTRPYLVDMLLDLEKSKGGHGNGFYFFGGNHIYKSATMPINKMIKKGAWKHGFLFHTRLATHGNQTRLNTHPFRLDGGEVIIHNGIWSNYKIALPFCNPRSKTDSEVLGYWIRNKGYTEMPSDYGSNAILMRIVVDGKNKIVVGKQSGGDLVVVKAQDYAWIQSEKPKDNDSYDEYYTIDSGVYVIDNSVEGVLTLPERTYGSQRSTHGYAYGFWKNGAWHTWDEISNTRQQKLDKNITKKVEEEEKWWAWGA